MLKINGIVSLLQHLEHRIPPSPQAGANELSLPIRKGYYQNPTYHKNSSNELLPKAISSSSIVSENLFVKRSVKDKEKEQKNDSNIQIGITSASYYHCPIMIEDTAALFKSFLIPPKIPGQGEPCRS